MAKKKRHHEEENHERWLVSYADFITLLFAFFVVMYAMSSVNEGKYRVLSETLIGAFDETLAGKGGTPVGIEEGGAIISMPDPRIASPDAVQQPDPESESSPEKPTEPDLPAVEEAAQTEPAEQQGQSAAVDGGLEAIAGDIRSRLGDLIDEELAEIQLDERWLEINLKSKLLFESGKARLNRKALRALRDISKALRKIPNQVHVEGYTDNVPIRTVEFPSNWELSAARAASVVHYLARVGVDPSRMAAVGFGQYRPKGDNATEEGRAKNRRISLLIMAGEANDKNRGSVRLDAGAEQ